jgi:hypothetical protein
MGIVITKQHSYKELLYEESRYWGYMSCNALEEGIVHDLHSLSEDKMLCS